jgi:predicted AlkP superfamily pyrophosphatase or phosphodiesterase
LPWSAVLLLGFAGTACEQPKTSPNVVRATPPAGGTTAANPPRPATAPATKPVPAVRRVILISVDGLRPDLIFRGGCIHIAALLDSGTFTLWARTCDVPFTLPSHASMLTGVKPSRHGIEENEYRLDHFPAVPTLFDAAREKGLSTAFVAGKGKLKVLCRPGSVTHDLAEDQPDDEVADRAVALLKTHRPELMVVHFRGVDYGGHFGEWGSPKQIAALRPIDDGVGKIVAAVDAADGGLAGETVILLTADHGGAGLSHWNDVRSTTIPWIVRGPGIRRGFDLDRLGGDVVRTEDTFATVAMFLGLSTYSDIDGKPITDVLDAPGGELLQPADK